MRFSHVKSRARCDPPSCLTSCPGCLVAHGGHPIAVSTQAWLRSDSRAARARSLARLCIHPKWCCCLSNKVMENLHSGFTSDALHSPVTAWLHVPTYRIMTISTGRVRISLEDDNQLIWWEMKCLHFTLFALFPHFILLPISFKAENKSVGINTVIF